VGILEYALSLARDLAHSWPSWPPSILSVCNSSIIFIGGTNCHTRNFKETKPTDWCVNCQHYGHTTPICHKTPRCLYCTGDHPTVQHKCNTCRASKDCEHVTCVNCTGSHAANDKKCSEWQIVLQKQHRNRTRTNRQDSPDPLN
jgi:hypothetical protein